MNPNKQQKQRALVSAPSAEGERSEKVPVGKAVAQLLAAELAPTLLAAGLEREKALERENKELKAKETNAEALRTQVEYWRNRAQERKARAEKAEAENIRLNKELVKKDQQRAEFERKAKKAEAKLAAIEKDLRERRLTQYELLLEHFPAVKAKEPELCGVCGGKRGLCLCLEGTPKKVGTR